MRAGAIGDGVLELRAVNATRANIYAKGAVWGQLDQGQLEVTDFNPDDNDHRAGERRRDEAPDRRAAA